MNGMDATAPEVTAMHQIPRFYREGEKDYIEIGFVGSKDTVVNRVKPEHMSRFRAEWDAYCDGRPAQIRSGTVLTAILTELRAGHYISHNVHTLEEIEALSDSQCQALGHGTITDRNNARKFMAQKRFNAEEAAKKVIGDAHAKIGPVPDQMAGEGLKQVNAKLDALTENIGALVRILSDKKKPGRPKKVPNEPADNH